MERKALCTHAELTLNPYKTPTRSFTPLAAAMFVTTALMLNNLQFFFALCSLALFWGANAHTAEMYICRSSYTDFFPARSITTLNKKLISFGMNIFEYNYIYTKHPINRHMATSHIILYLQQIIFFRPRSMCMCGWKIYNRWRRPCIFMRRVGVSTGIPMVGC